MLLFLRGVLATLLALSGASVAFSACIDLVPVAPPAEQPAVLHLSLRLGDVAEGGDLESALVTVTGALATGVDEIGRTRAIQNDTLFIFGEPVPAADTGVGRGVYSETLLLDRDALFFGPFLIRAPIIDNLETLEFAVGWPLLSKAEPQPTTVQPGEDLVLPLAFEGFPGQPAPEVQRWSVAVFLEEGWFSQGADGLPPTEIVVPATLLGQPGTGMLAIVSMHHSVEIASRDGYLTRLELSQELRWNVQVAGLPAGNTADLMPASPNPFVHRP